MTGFYLLDHRNPHGDHFHPTRRGTVLAIVVHVTAGLEDLDTIDDHSAEKTAAYAASTDRPVSWHSGSDTDSALDLLPAGFTAFHCVGYNSRTYGHEISKANPDWRAMSPGWVDATLHRSAHHLAIRARELGVPVRHATRAELDEAIARNGQPVGFLGHHQLDPARRTDPGLVDHIDTFPWDRFLGLVRSYQQPPAPPAAQPDPRRSRPMLLNIKDSPYFWFVRGVGPDLSLVLVEVTAAEAWELAAAGVTNVSISAATFDKIRKAPAWDR